MKIWITEVWIWLYNTYVNGVQRKLLFLRMWLGVPFLAELNNSDQTCYMLFLKPPILMRSCAIHTQFYMHPCSHHPVILFFCHWQCVIAVQLLLAILFHNWEDGYVENAILLHINGQTSHCSLIPRLSVGPPRAWVRGQVWLVLLYKDTCTNSNVLVPPLKLIMWCCNHS